MSRTGSVICPSLGCVAGLHGIAVGGATAFGPHFVCGGDVGLGKTGSVCAFVGGTGSAVCRGSGCAGAVAGFRGAVLGVAAFDRRFVRRVDVVVAGSGFVSALGGGAGGVACRGDGCARGVAGFCVVVSGGAAVCGWSFVRDGDVVVAGSGFVGAFVGGTDGVVWRGGGCAGGVA